MHGFEEGNINHPWLLNRGMKTRKQKSTRTETSKRKVSCDVSPSTSLPPLVEGQLRCFLRVTISQILWTVQKPPPATFVRLRWWGESSDGTHFFPKDGSQASQKTIKTTARFPIRCGPKQFTSYLTDMGFLVLEVLTKPDHLPIARAQVLGISHLSLSQPLNGFYSLLSPTSKKLGELHVSLNLEPLTEAYDNSTSSPNKDETVKGLQVPTPTASSQLHSHLVNFRSRDQHVQEDKGSSLENQMPKTNIPHKHQTAPNSSNQEICGQTTSDLLSVILERGNKLRNALAVSALKGDMSTPALKESPLPLPKDNILLDSKPFSSSSETPFLQNIINAGSSFKPSNAVVLISDSLDHPADTDNRAIDLLLGSPTPSPLVLWDGEEPFHGSAHSSVCVDSELSDPQYDQSLLENLFYKSPILDVRESDADVKDQKVSLRQPQVTQSGPEISRGSNSEPQQSAEDGGLPPGLSSEQMTLLSSVRDARVTIDSLTVPEDTTARKSSTKWKPPRPIPSKKCTYFIEYVFPVHSSHRDCSKGAGQEVTRAVSSKVAAQEVNFHHLSVFPVRLTTATVRRWSETELIFKLYIRKSDQRKPVLIGKAIYLLNYLLQNKQLSQTVFLPVQNMEGDGEFSKVGPLKVSIELTTVNRDLSSNKSQTKLASGVTFSPRRETNKTTQCDDIGRGDDWSPGIPVKEPSSQPDLHASADTSRHQVEEESEILLHALLMVPDGRNFSCGSMKAPSLYLNCKLFWSDAIARSIVSWSQANPSFHFVQVTPVALTNKLLERLKNNVMVIEVWQKIGSSGQDQLLGLVKLPLHQFYMSFRDPKIARLLLQAQYPVLGVDCCMPVIDVFSGHCKGNLRVVLAMGKSEQIIALQRTRDDEYDSSSHLMRPVHLLDHQPQSRQSKVPVIAAQKEAMREHVFVIRVDKVKGLMPLQSTVWGEADCYVQYSFVSQDLDSIAEADHNLIETSINLKPFRTTTTLCVPDPVFGHTETHVLQAPNGMPVQRLLLSSLSGQGLGSGGGVQFEVWCRYYYPNVRDQLVAKSILPLSKLCALVTMQRQHPSEAEMFSLPLFPRTDSSMGHQSKPSGLIDVWIRYKHRLMGPEGLTGGGVASHFITLVVQVHRASGLQAAARLVAEQDESLQYFASVGVNAYVSVQLSFLDESELSCTRAVARSFCPEFDHHMEVPCDLLLHSSKGETRSLAEELQEASAVFTLWNRGSRTGEGFTRESEDVILGTVEIPLIDLIRKRTGISGWFGVHLHQEKSSSQQRHNLVGGLDVSLRFAHHSDWEKVIKAAHGVGWEMAQSEVLGDDEAWTESRTSMTLTISMPRVWLPVHCLLLPGHNELQRSTFCYFRYKFYDDDAFCSQMRHPSFEEVEEEGLVTVTFQESRTIELGCTQPLMWYLREEKLEVQVWSAFTKDKTQRPQDTDRLVGSAFIDLSSFAKTSRQKVTISGVFPLFRRSAADLQGASLRVHITLVTGSVKNLAEHIDSDHQEELLLEESEEADQDSLPSKSRSKSCRTVPDITALHHTETDLDGSFPVSVVVDRAMHLSLKGCPLAERSESSPCCCVSYVTADSSEAVSTAVIARTDCPVWDHQHQCRLSKQLLVDSQQSLVFKVWHKGEMERVIGFASVDLSPLLWGFQSVCGWYNITDFSGRCHGQLKVSITPLKCVQELRGQRKPVNEESTKKSSAFSLSYHTTATYSSFPSHISQYSEQMISSPDHTRIFLSDRANDSDRHVEHMDNVRLYHQSLHEQTAPPSGSVIMGDVHPSSSFLISTLRKKLSELDNIQRYFNQKLSPPTFPSWGEQDVSASKPEIQRETDACQLLSKSKQLVGEVNSIITGLRGQHQEKIPSDLESGSLLLSGQNDSFGILPGVASPQRASNSSQEVFPLPSSLANILEDTTDSEPEEETGQQSCDDSGSEGENRQESDGNEHEEGCKLDSVGDDDDGDEVKDYDEVVVKPRSLNEVTSLTDKTSPWTSVLSDLDMGSLESMEETSEATLTPDDSEKLQIFNQQTPNCDEQHGCGRQGARSSDCGETEGERTIETEERHGKESESHSDLSHENSLSPHKQDVGVTDDASSSQDKQPQASDPTEVPNFFLPSHRLEASMRAIQLAASFRDSLSDLDHTSLVHPRRPRHPNMKKETERIAKIFAARYNDNE
ncbi:C2 domain-containing protein 3 isoform X2 [Takifugu rubripes]|uniref:C2 domain-containing protein 3 isoform X2 n=1 Tax=Takifugu rubripes TaxID=31033 RepID=UPI001145A331|nr:C2 domain-containing protein 3 isoform X2 [Takifugu rubripes]